jgi:arylsulfatase A-like enzyme
LDGVDFLPLLTGTTRETRDRTLFWRVGKRNAVRHGSWKLIRDGGAWRLYDLAHDIGEADDLAPREARRVAELSSLWTEWDARQVEPLWR